MVMLLILCVAVAAGPSNALSLSPTSLSPTSRSPSLSPTSLSPTSLSPTSQSPSLSPTTNSPSTISPQTHVPAGPPTMNAKIDFGGAGVLDYNEPVTQMVTGGIILAFLIFCFFGPFGLFKYRKKKRGDAQPLQEIKESPEVEMPESKLEEAQPRLSGPDDGKSESRKKIRGEIMDTERKYVSALRLLDEVYLTALADLKGKEKSYGLTPQTLQALEMNVKTLVVMHNDMFTALEKTESANIPQVLNKYADLMKCYIVYLNGYQDCLKILTELKQKNKKFAELIEGINEQLALKGTLVLGDYMIMPVQRVPRYVLLLQELIKNSSESHTQWNNMQSSLKKIKEIASAINEGQRNMENALKLMQLSNLLKKVPKDFDLVKPHRKLIKEGVVTITETGTKKSSSDSDKLHNLYLFNDILMLTGTEKQWRHVIDLAAAKVVDSKEINSFEINTHSFHTVVRLDDEKQATDWKTIIADEIEKRKASRATKRVLGARGNKELISKKGSIHAHISGRFQELADGGEASGRESRGLSRASSAISERGTTRSSALSEADIDEKEENDRKEENDEREGDSSAGEELMG